MKKSTIQLLIWGLVILIIIILAVTSGNKDTDEEILIDEIPIEQVEETDEEEETMEEVAEENAEEETEEILTVSSEAMTPIQDGEFYYTFQGIDWVTEDEGDKGTRVAFFLKDFSRRENGTIANLQRPFGVSYYPGPCQTIENGNNTSGQGTPISFLSCSDTTIGIFQNDITIDVKSQDKGSTDWVDIRTINMGEILR